MEWSSEPSGKTLQCFPLLEIRTGPLLPVESLHAVFLLFSSNSPKIHHIQLTLVPFLQLCKLMGVTYLKEREHHPVRASKILRDVGVVNFDKVGTSPNGLNWHGDHMAARVTKTSNVSQTYGCELPRSLKCAPTKRSVLRVSFKSWEL